MRYIKKVIISILTLCMLLGLVGCKSKQTSTNTVTDSKGKKTTLFDKSGLKTAEPEIKDGKLYIKRGSVIKADRFTMTITDILKAEPKSEDGSYFLCANLDVSSEIGYKMYDDSPATIYDTIDQLLDGGVIFDYKTNSQMFSLSPLLLKGSYQIVMTLNERSDGSPKPISVRNEKDKKTVEYFIDKSSVTSTVKDYPVQHFGYENRSKNQQVLIDELRLGESKGDDRLKKICMQVNYAKFGDKLVQILEFDVGGEIKFSYANAEVTMNDGMIYRLMDQRDEIQCNPKSVVKITLKDKYTGKIIKEYTDLTKINDTEKTIQWDR